MSKYYKTYARWFVCLKCYMGLNYEVWKKDEKLFKEFWDDYVRGARQK